MSEDDIVMRLRDADRGYEPGTMFTKAADRIEALEAEVAAWRSQCLEAEFQEAERSRTLRGASARLTAMTANAMSLAELVSDCIEEDGEENMAPIWNAAALAAVAAHTKLMEGLE